MTQIVSKSIDEDKENGFFDEFGVLYSKDGLRLLEGNSDLTNYTVREGTRVICDSAFGFCSSLTSIALPSGLTIIGDYAFEDCESLTSLTLPEGLTTIGSNPFLGCKNLMLFNKSPHFKIIDDMLLCSEGTHLITYFGKESECIVPDSVKSIGDSAFLECKSLIILTLPSGLTTIEDSAFEGCSSLTNLTLPSGLTTIGDSAFLGCKNLMFFSKSPHFKIIDDMLLGSEGTHLITYFGKESECIVPDSVKSIGNYAFWGCFSLTSLTLPSGLTTIGDSAFLGCESLTSLTLSSGLTTIGDSAFLGCESLTSLILPSGLTTIEDSAFANCSSLTSLTLPSGLTTIGDWAFSGCFSLESLHILQGTEEHFKKILPSEYHSTLRIQSNSQS